jgi:hypothetical protein
LRLIVVANVVRQRRKVNGDQYVTCDETVVNRSQDPAVFFKEHLTLCRYH